MAERMARIRAALDRIEAAAARQRAREAALGKRHARLRERISEAIAALDHVIGDG